MKTATDIGSPFIIVLTETGNTARLVAKYFPPMPVYVVTSHAHVARQCAGYMRACHCKLIGSVHGSEDIILEVLKEQKEKGFCKSGDAVICVYGTTEGIPGSTNMIKLHYVA